MTQLRLTWQRKHILQTLQEAGGFVESRSGQATRKLFDLAQMDIGMQAFTQMLAVMQDQGLIKRTINAKRCYKVEIGNLSPQLSEIIFGKVITLEELEQRIADAIVESSEEPENLTDNVLNKMIDNPHKENLEKLQQDRDYFATRVAELTAENNRLRLQIDPLKDEVKAQKEINVGLRSQIRILQANIEKLTPNNEELRRNEAAFKDYRRLMQEPPRSPQRL